LTLQNISQLQVIAFYVNRDPLLEAGLPANPPGYNFFRDQLRQGGSR
jgi:hypothetical protein